MLKAEASLQNPLGSVLDLNGIQLKGAKQVPRHGGRTLLVVYVSLLLLCDFVFNACRLVLGAWSGLLSKGGEGAS